MTKFVLFLKIDVMFEIVGVFLELCSLFLQIAAFSVGKENYACLKGNKIHDKWSFKCTRNSGLKRFDLRLTFDSSRQSKFPEHLPLRSRRAPDRPTFRASASPTARAIRTRPQGGAGA